MTEEIIIDASNCSRKRDDDCMEAPICNEYGDLMGYQSCEAQTLCPYRSQKKIERLEQLKNKYYQQTLDDEITISDLITKCNDLEQENNSLQAQLNNITVQSNNVITALEQENKELKARVKAEIHLGNNYKKDFAEQVTIAENYRSALEEIRELAEKSIKISYNLEVNSMLYDIKDKISEVLK